MCVRACVRACLHVCMYACMHVFMYSCMHVCMYACMYYVRVYIFTFAHTYTCMYTLTHSIRFMLQYIISKIAVEMKEVIVICNMNVATAIMVFSSNKYLLFSGNEEVAEATLEINTKNTKDAETIGRFAFES